MLLPACSALNFLFPLIEVSEQAGDTGMGDLASTLNFGSEGIFRGKNILSLCNRIVQNLTHSIEKCQAALKSRLRRSNQRFVHVPPHSIGKGSSSSVR